MYKRKKRTTSGGVGPGARAKHVIRVAILSSSLASRGPELHIVHEARIRHLRTNAEPRRIGAEYNGAFQWAGGTVCSVRDNKAGENVSRRLVDRLFEESIVSACSKVVAVGMRVPPEKQPKTHIKTAQYGNLIDAEAALNRR